MKTILSKLSQGRPYAANQAGWLAFQFGLFILPSSAFLAGLLLVPALIFGSLNRHRSYWLDPWNWPFCIAFIAMLLGAINAYSGWLAWVGLANWFPFFWSFWAFQPYLISAEARRRSALWLVAGTVPVLATGFGQLFWGWSGPWQIFNGLIIWFVEPGGQPNGRLSGLFDYANIAGAWLAIVWPLALAALLQKGLSRSLRGLVLILVASIVASLVLTDSRNAWGGLILAIPFVIGPIHWFWLLPLLFVALLPVTLAVIPGVPNELQIWARKLVPESLWARLNDMRYNQVRTLASTRLSQWSVALRLIAERPWLGWGAAAFSVLYPLRTGQWHGHAHNLPLEVAVSHGFLVALCVVGMIITLLITALKRGVLVCGISNESRANIFDRAWWTASLILIVLHGTDLPFFDSRLNIVGWVLLAGLRCVICPKSHINQLA